MRGMWKHLERLGGGVGTRGPGESQLETDRRLARTRVSLLKRRLRTLQGQRSTRRKERVRAATPTVALAGYTNVGKSTLLNALTGADASVDDRLFETLDPTTRAFEHDGKRYLVTDTVGFIRRLPTQLVEGFAATLEETLVSDLILHVADASLPRSVYAETIGAVEKVLSDIGADDVPVELVLNKADALDPLARRRIEHTYPRALLISAQTGEGLDALEERVAELFSDRFEDVRLLVPYAEGNVLTALYDLGAPIAERRDTAEGVRVRARLPRAEAARFARYLVAEDEDELEASVAVIDVADSPTAAGRPRFRIRPTTATRGSTSRPASTSLLSPGERAVVPTGLAVEIPDGYAGFVQPRSGLAARHGIGIVNSPGLIDSGYRGEIRVILLNTGDEAFSVEPGMRVAQLVVVTRRHSSPRRGGRAHRERAWRSGIRLILAVR